MFHVKQLCGTVPRRFTWNVPRAESDRTCGRFRTTGYIVQAVNLDAQLRTELEQLRGQDRLRDTRPLAGPGRVHTTTPEGGALLSFCTNDYLGLAGHPALARAAAQATDTFGFGAGASRLVSGETPPHVALEAALAGFLNRPAALVFPTGYQTNLGVLTALAGPTDLVVSDIANHASIVDGCRLSRARIVIYPHCDATEARAALATPGPFRRRLLVSESIFSMDGDRAPLPALAAAAASHDAVFILDEAHALGVVGQRGCGLAAELGVFPDITIGTLGKAFGGFGGFVAGTSSLRALLINRARQFIFTTAAPPALAAAASTALELAASPFGTHLRERARELATHLRHGLARLGIQAPGQDLIIPLILGSEARALAAARALLDQGILVPAIRPPTVAPGASRLRVTISAAHTLADVDRLIDAVAGIPSLMRATP